MRSSFGDITFQMVLLVRRTTKRDKSHETRRVAGPCWRRRYPRCRSCVHPGAKLETSSGTAPPTGIDYLALVGTTTIGYIDGKHRRPWDDG